MSLKCFSFKIGKGGGRMEDEYIFPQAGDTVDEMRMRRMKEQSEKRSQERRIYPMKAKVQNELPINQAAMMAMQGLGYEISPGFLYALQLAIEEVEYRLIEFHEDDLLEFLVMLLGINPDILMEHLIPEVTLRLNKKEMSQFLQESETDPKDFAAEIVAAFEDWRLDLRDQE